VDSSNGEKMQTPQLKAGTSLDIERGLLSEGKI